MLLCILQYVKLHTIIVTINTTVLLIIGSVTINSLLCSSRCARPGSSGGSWNEPTLTHKPQAAYKNKNANKIIMINILNVILPVIQQCFLVLLAKAYIK